MAPTKRINESARAYNEAIELFDDGDFNEALVAAKYNLMDLTLPRYYQLKNCLIMISAEDDWAEAEKFHLAAEEIWRIAKDMSDESNEEEREYLRGFRDTFDKMRKHQLDRLMDDEGIEIEGWRDESDSDEEERDRSEEPHALCVLLEQIKRDREMMKQKQRAGEEAVGEHVRDEEKAGEEVKLPASSEEAVAAKMEAKTEWGFLTVLRSVVDTVRIMR